MPFSSHDSCRVALLSIVALAAFQMACSRSDENSGTRTTTGPSAAAAAPVALAPAATGGTAPACPEGRWKYDYTDRFLESVANAGRTRVVSERGEFICTFTGRDRGSYVCATTTGGVENVFEATTAGGPMMVTVRLDGQSRADYEPAGPSRWRTTRADLHDLNMQASATIAGRALPLPAFNLFPGLDRAGTVLEYRCEGDALKLKPQVEGIQTDWLTMQRAR